VKARTIHGDRGEAGVPLTRTFHDHLLGIMKSDARNPEVQNRYDGALARDPRRPGPDLSFSGNEAKPLFHNTGNGFVEIGTTMGIGRTEDCRGFVLADLDGDGGLDVVMHNYFRNPIVALLNRAAGEGRWLRIRLHGTKSNRFGIGARVTVNGKVQDLFCGSGYLSSGPPELHFGLGQAQKADVKLRWPSGKVEDYAGLEVDRIHTFVEGDPSGHRVEELRRETIDVPAPPPPRPDVEVRSLVRGLVTLEGSPAGIEEPAILILFRTGCHTCRKDLRRLQELESQAKGLGVRLAWVSIDPDVKKVAEEFRLNGATVMPLEPDRPITLGATPTVYFVDGKRLEKYTGRFAVTAAFADAARLIGSK
jgi:thiol-disulfide isomerase/thioredoxin